MGPGSPCVRERVAHFRERSESPWLEEALAGIGVDYFAGSTLAGRAPHSNSLEHVWMVLFLAG